MFSKGPFINDVSSIFRIYEGVPTLVSPRLLWLNDPLEETSFLRPTAPLPPPVPILMYNMGFMPAYDIEDFFKSRAQA